MRAKPTPDIKFNTLEELCPRPAPPSDIAQKQGVGRRELNLSILLADRPSENAEADTKVRTHQESDGEIIDKPFANSDESCAHRDLPRVWRNRVWRNQVRTGVSKLILARQWSSPGRLKWSLHRVGPRGDVTAGLYCVVAWEAFGKAAVVSERVVHPRVGNDTLMISATEGIAGSG